LIIEDGTGKGYSAQVDDQNLLNTRAVTKTELVSQSEIGLAYSWSNISYSYTAGDTILLIRNDNPLLDLFIDNIFIQGAVATEVVIHCPTIVFTPTGTTVTGINMNRKSGTTSLSTAKANETANTQGDVVFRGAIAAAPADPYLIALGGALILGNGQSVGVDYTTIGAAARVTIIGHFSVSKLS
jgi:hypothetical protein